MPKLLGGLFAFVALAVCIVNGIEPWTSTVRGLVAFFVGHLAGALWESIFGQPGGTVVEASSLIPNESKQNDDNLDPPEEAAA
ncbi:hypothetical protein C0431_04345 [bacterium]|jgi:hypothetical protein|nr:hypothetical protein [bacterium]